MRLLMVLKAQGRSSIMKRSGVAIAFSVAASLAATAASAQATLNKVKQKGFLVCGSNPALPGFGIPDAQGNWTGFDIDYCRAYAAAIFNDPTNYKVRFIPLSGKDRFTALQSGQVDVLVRNSTWTMSRDTQLGLDFSAVNYYDGQSFMVRKKLGVSSAKELNGATICTQQGTTTELNLADFFRSNNINRVYFEKRSFSSSGLRWSLTQRRSAMTKGSRFKRASKSATRRVRSCVLAWQ